jgi:hypothetical protein
VRFIKIIYTYLMRKIVAMFLAVSLLLVCTFAQADTEDVVEHNVNLDSRQPTPEEQQRYMSMRRTACLVLSRHHSNSHRDEIEPIIQGLPVEGQQKFINKMYSVAVEDCEQVITPEEVNQLYVENPSFDPSSLFHLFATVDYTALSKDNFKLTKNQETIVQYIKNFDEEMEVKREEQKAEQDKLLGDERNEFKVKNHPNLGVWYFHQGGWNWSQNGLSFGVLRCGRRTSLLRHPRAQQGRQTQEEEIQEGRRCFTTQRRFARLTQKEE